MIYISTQIYKRDEAFNTNEIANGVLASLVAVTGCCPFIEPLMALPIGGMNMCLICTLQPLTQQCMPQLCWTHTECH